VVEPGAAENVQFLCSGYWLDLVRGAFVQTRHDDPDHMHIERSMMNLDHVHDGTRVRVIHGALESTAAEVLVTAVTPELQPATLGSRAVFSSAGPALEEACAAWLAEHGEGRPGRCVSTEGFALDSVSLVHAVVSPWIDGQKSEYVDLERAHDSALRAAVALGATTVAMPALAAAAGAFPANRASFVAFNAIFRFAMENPGKVETVTVVLTDDDDAEAYAEAFAKVVRTMLGT